MKRDQRGKRNVSTPSEKKHASDLEHLSSSGGALCIPEDQFNNVFRREKLTSLVRILNSKEGKRLCSLLEEK